MFLIDVQNKYLQYLANSNIKKQGHQHLLIFTFQGSIFTNKNSAEPLKKVQNIILLQKKTYFEVVT